MKTKKTSTTKATAESTAGPTPAAATTAPTPATTGGGTALITPPPVGVVIPAPPTGTVPVGGAAYRGIIPTVTEFSKLPAAVTDVQNATDFSATFGLSGYSQAQVAQALNAGLEWTGMRKQLDAFDGYAQTQEGLVWEQIRPMMKALNSVLPIVTKMNPTATAQFPNLVAFLAAKAAAAKQAVSTKRLNKAAVADGKLPTHGKVGKQRSRSAAKAALAAANGQPAAKATPPSASPPVPAASTGAQPTH